MRTRQLHKKKNYEVQSLSKLTLKDELKKKSILKNDKKN
jgi:hypothetical protein